MLFLRRNLREIRALGAVLGRIVGYHMSISYRYRMNRSSRILTVIVGSIYKISQLMLSSHY